MNNKPNLSDFRMSTQNQIFIKTVVEMADKFKLICSGLENCDWSEVTCVPPNGPEYSRFNLPGDTWAELMDLVSIYMLRIPNWNGYHHLRNSTLAIMVFDIPKKKRKNIGIQWGWVQAIICLSGTKSIHRREIVKRTTDVLLY